MSNRRKDVMLYVMEWVFAAILGAALMGVLWPLLARDVSYLISWWG